MSELSARPTTGKEGAAPRAPRRQSGGEPDAPVEVPGFELTLDEERVPPPVRENSFRAFTPANIGAHLERFQALAARLAPLSPSGARRELELEIAWADNLESGFEPALRPRSLRKYRAALSVVGDLISQDWVFRFRDHQLELAPPDFTEAPRTPEDVSRQKASIRRSMRAERLAQLQPESVGRFLRDMEEKKSRAGKAPCSVLDLVADGDGLARELREAQRLTSGYEERVLEVVQPYIQLASEEACPESGFRLLDIWRYFRYFWSLPYFSTPGRNLFYLVRDAARPFHPVIGIAALGNSLVRLADREHWIGWDVASLEERLKNAPDADRGQLAASLFRHFRGVIDTAIASLDPTGIVTAAELKNPTEETVLRLAHVARDSAQKRREFLKRHEADARTDKTNGKPARRSRPLEPSQMMLAAPADRTLADHSVDELFKQKRAAQYSDLVRAKLAFAAATEASIEPMLLDEAGRRALSVAIKNVKQDHIGSSMMDIIICGAIPPYSHLLGGKLVCMLLTSPQVRLDYPTRNPRHPGGGREGVCQAGGRPPLAPPTPRAAPGVTAPAVRRTERRTPPPDDGGRPWGWGMELTMEHTFVTKTWDGPNGQEMNDAQDAWAAALRSPTRDKNGVIAALAATTDLEIQQVDIGWISASAALLEKRTALCPPAPVGAALSLFIAEQRRRTRDWERGLAWELGMLPPGSSNGYAPDGWCPGWAAGDHPREWLARRCLCTTSRRLEGEWIWADPGPYLAAVAAGMRTVGVIDPDTLGFEMAIGA